MILINSRYPSKEQENAVESRGESPLVNEARTEAIGCMILSTGPKSDRNLETKYVDEFSPRGLNPIMQRLRRDASARNPHS